MTGRSRGRDHSRGRDQRGGGSPAAARTSRCCASPRVSFPADAGRALPGDVHSVAAGRPRAPAARRRAGERLCAPGELTPARLAQAAGRTAGGLSLRYGERPLTWREYRAWRRKPGRERLAQAGSRFAVVGLAGPADRRADPAVAAGPRAGSGRHGGRRRAGLPRRAPAPARYPYYGQVTRDRGFVALQYWFLYAMNDWRSTFGGVNDHEADWEQVTVFLPDPPDPAARPAWVAFSSTTRPAMTCAAGRTTPTSSGGTPTRWSSRAPVRTPGPTCPGTT